MEEYRRLNMRATTVGMWGGIIAGGLISQYTYPRDGHIRAGLTHIAAALKRRTKMSSNALTFTFLCMFIAPFPCRPAC